MSLRESLLVTARYDDTGLSRTAPVASHRRQVLTVIPPSTDPVPFYLISGGGT